MLLRFDVRRAAANFERLQPGFGEAAAEALWSAPLSRDFETGRLPGTEFHRRVSRRAGLRLSYARFCRAFNDIFTPVRENLSLLSSLARRETVALLSNTNPIHWRHMFLRYPVLRRAHWPFSSHMLGALKPSPRIYRALSEKTGVPLRRMVYVDDREDFIRAARRLGVTAVHFTGERLLKDDFAALGLLKGKGSSRWR